MNNKQNKMTFGIQPTCWTNDDFPEIGNDCAYQVILDQTEEAGFAEPLAPLGASLGAVFLALALLDT